MSAPKNLDRMWMVACGALLASPIVVSSIASAGPILPPSLVPGKEYSNHVDETAGGLADFLQNIAWDGLGGAVDTFDYSGSGRPILPGGDPEPMDPDMVDALANNNDFLFDPVRMSAVPFVVSFGGIGDIYFHDTAGATGIWALGPVDINVGSPPDDVDGLELWGSPAMDDADRFSIIGDALGGGTAIFTYDPVAHNSVPYLTHAALASAIGVGHTVDIDVGVLDSERGEISVERVQEILVRYTVDLDPTAYRGEFLPEMELENHDIEHHNVGQPTSLSSFDEFGDFEFHLFVPFWEQIRVFLRSKRIAPLKIVYLSSRQRRSTL